MGQPAAAGQRWHALVSEPSPRGAAWLLLWLLRLASAFYFLAWVGYRALYGLALLRPLRLPCPVISIGNLTLGGSGKTTAVIGLAAWLRQQGYRVAVLLRGYRGRRPHGTALVSDGERLLMNLEQAGDEAILLAQALPGVAVVVGKDRRRSARLAIQQLGANFLILDDGFQYWRLQKDAEVLLWDATRPQHALRLFPAGILREPICALRRATHLWLTRSDLGGDTQALVQDLRRKSRLPVALTRHAPLQLLPIGGDHALPTDLLAHQRLLAFAGIGNFPAFLETVRRLGTNLVAYLDFPDHHPYSEQDLQRITTLAQEHGAQALLTTTKDAVRLREGPESLPTYALAVRLEACGATPTEALWHELLQAATRPPRKPRSWGKTLQGRVGYLFLRALSCLATRLPEPMALWCGSRLGEFIYLAFPNRRRIALKNLNWALGSQMIPSRLRSLCVRNFRFAGQVAVEFLRFPLMTAEDLRERVALREEHFLKEAYARGRGVIVLTAHFGHWESMGARIAQDYRLAGLARPSDDALTQDLINRIRQGTGAEVIYRDEVRGALRTLLSLIHI